MSDKTNAQKVIEFLQKHPKSWYRDSCISLSTAVEPPNQVNQVTRPLGETSDFDRMRGQRCRRCGETRSCTRTTE